MSVSGTSVVNLLRGFVFNDKCMSMFVKVRVATEHSRTVHCLVERHVGEIVGGCGEGFLDVITWPVTVLMILLLCGSTIVSLHALYSSSWGASVCSTTSPLVLKIRSGCIVHAWLFRSLALKQNSQQSRSFFNVQFSYTYNSVSLCSHLSCGMCLSFNSLLKVP